ncbi:MAG: MFS transporter [Nitrospirae bacterium]|nr:MAG: MFS transporter [Nitrospirota bacterium]
MKSREFVLLCLVGCLCFVSYDLVRRPALALFAESLGATPSQVGIIIALSTLTGVMLKLPIGVASDILDRRKLMILGLLAFAFPPFVYPWITDLAMLGALRFCHGLATAVFTPLALAVVAETYAVRRGEALGWYTSATQGGGLLGPSLGGVLVYAVGFGPTFVTAGLFGLISLAVFFLIRQPSPPVSSSKSAEQVFHEVRDGIRAVLRHRGILLTSMTEAAKMMANGTLMAFLPLYGVAIGLNAAQVGLLFGVQALTSFVSKPIMGRVSDQVGRIPLIVCGLCLCGGTILFIPAVSTFALLLLLAAGFGFGEAVVTSSSAALIADLAREKAIGAGMGLRGTIMDMGHAGGPLLAGVLIDQIGYGGGFGVMGTIPLLAAATFGVLMMGLRRPAML